MSVADTRSSGASHADERLQDLGASYPAVRVATEALAAPLSPEDCAVQSMPDASPVKWHLAHTSWFFETFVLESAIAGYRHFHPRFRVLFNSYYNTVGDQYARPRRGLLTRPGLDEVLAYRAHVDERLVSLLRKGRVEGRLLDAIELGLHHEQQHQELMLTDVKHLLGCNPLRPAYRADLPADVGRAAALRWQTLPEAIVEIGHDGRGFAFDNEGPRHRVLVPAFEIASRPVTNAEFLEFVRDGGYTRPEHWLSDGWLAKSEQGWRAPLHWEEGENDSWRNFTLGGLREMQADEPVCHVSYYEADAFARWAGARLPTEFEWERVASGRPIEGNFVDSGRLHPAPSGSESPGGQPAQLFGDVWEWTASPYTAYPGYRPAAGALGEYNGKFMCNQLVLRGGSCATPRSHVRATYRNFFPAPARWQFTGFRLARDAA